MVAFSYSSTSVRGSGPRGSRQDKVRAVENVQGERPWGCVKACALSRPSAATCKELLTLTTEAVTLAPKYYAERDGCRPEKAAAASSARLRRCGFACISLRTAPAPRVTSRTPR